MISPDQPDLFAELPILAEVGTQLERILAEDDTQLGVSRRCARRRFARRRRLRLLAVVVVLVLGGTAAALAAAGVILTGSPVRPSGPVVPTAGVGIPVVGGSRLLPLRAADPAGGLPWGMRVVHTTRSEICVQAGRVYHGQLGQLGIDGAFGNDGRFHPLPADVLQNAAGFAGSWYETCTQPGRTFTYSSLGLEANAAIVGAGAESRSLSFGLLGPHAVSITYRSGNQTHTARVLPTLGAYLIVQKYTNTSPTAVRSNGDNLPYPQTDPASPSGALTAIDYEFAGRACVDNAIGGLGLAGVNEFNDRITRFRRACGLSEGPPPRPPALPNVRETLHVHLQIHHRVITGAEITFTAPIAITKASQSYLAWVRVARHLTDLTETRTDVPRGATVSIPIEHLLARAGTRSVTIEIDYDQTLPGPPADDHAIVGTVTIQEPPGTHPAPAPRVP